MTQETKRELTPRLRFPEFQDAPRWEEKKLGDLSQILRGGSPRPIEDFLTTDINGLNWLKIGDVDKNSKYVTHTQERVRPVALNKTREVNPGDLILSNSMSFGRPYILKIKSCIHDGWIAITEIDKRIDRDYLYYLMISPAIQAYFLSNAAGSGVQNLNADIIKLLPILFPSPSEQQRIADCLASLDDLIAAQSQKLGALKAHKNGLLQQLFPAEGQTLPSLRFPEFQDVGEWQTKRLGELLLSHPDYGVNAPAVPYSEDLPAYLRITDISDEGIYLSDKKVSVDIDAGDENYLTEGDIALARTGASVGKSYKYKKEDGELVFAGYLIRIKPNQKRIDSTFLFNFLFTKQYWNWVGLTSARSGQPGINGNEYASLSIPIPPTNKDGKLAEQQKIADCLTSLDEQIAAQTQKLDALKAHKKGLMQQLFPSADEVQE